MDSSGNYAVIKLIVILTSVDILNNWIQSNSQTLEMFIPGACIMLYT